jgi:sulfite reductase alpha subunit-like flavoprotein
MPLCESFEDRTIHDRSRGLTHTALDALASRILKAGDSSTKHHLQLQAMAARLRGLGFQKIVDLPQRELGNCGLAQDPAHVGSREISVASNAYSPTQIRIAQVPFATTLRCQP